MIAESAICLVTECPDTPGGFHTSASAMGETLIKRLVEHAGLTFDLDHT
jgi:short subunit dehydrogenase-like uncharacterized protein